MEKEKKIWAMAVDIGGTKMDIAYINQDGDFYAPTERVLVLFDENGIADPVEMIELLSPFVEKAKQELKNTQKILLKEQTARKDEIHKHHDKTMALSTELAQIKAQAVAEQQKIATLLSELGEYKDGTKV